MKKQKLTILLAVLVGLFATTNLFSQEADFFSKVRDNDTKAVKAMIEAGTDVNYEYWGNTALGLAVTDNHPEMVKLLLSKGADINHQDKSTGYTHLMMALNARRPEMAELLISEGADIKIKGNDGATALILACGVSPEIAKTLLLKGADIHVLTDKGQGVFTQCIVVGMMRGNEKITPEFAEFLLSQGAEIDEKNTMSGYKGYTPLFWAVTYGETDVVKFLAEKGADVNAVAEGEKTPLSIAIETENIDIIEILKSHGAK